ncbi:hypothetical protein [Limnohabitans sp. TS-CS-82]|uniref:hypothetical protein n=1 Tax=Limnohabitans sp. TS-CS-82 TaxID=2094193 RepID=UPI0011AFE919|nr:hypothetical protein [Limnohabitans sp. TS-CS-82]
MSLIQELMNQAAVGGLFNASAIKRFSPAEIREAIQALVATEQTSLACALGDAGMSLYPESEDMLAINGLLAVMNQDWQLAVEFLEDLLTLQGSNTQPFTYVMLVRALRCNLDPVRAIQVVQQGLAAYPEQLELTAEALSLEEYANTLETNGYTH